MQLSEYYKSIKEIYKLFMKHLTFGLQVKINHGLGNILPLVGMKLRGFCGRHDWVGHYKCCYAI